MLTQQQLVDEYREERELLTEYLEALPDGAWDKESLCEGWRIRDVMSHVVGNATDIAAGNTADAGSEGYNARQVEERKGKTPRELLDEWKTGGPVFEEGVLALDDAFFNADYPPFGTVGQALQRFVEDNWIHRHDIRIPLGDGIDPRGPGARVTLEVVLREMPERASNHAPGLRSLTIDADGFSGSVQTAEQGADVTVTGDVPTIALIATGRVSFEEAAKDGKVTITGDAPDGFAKAFNIYAS